MDNTQFLEDTISRIFSSLLTQSISRTVWSDFIRSITINCSKEFEMDLFTKVFQAGRKDLIYIFCKFGINPFEGIDLPKKLYEKEYLTPNDLPDERLMEPPVFGLIKLKCKNESDFDAIFKSIFKGMSDYYMNEIAGLKERTRYCNLPGGHKFKPFETNLIQRSVSGNNNGLLHFLLKNSDVSEDKVMINTGSWSLLNECILYKKLEVIDHLMAKKHCIWLEGTKYVENEFEYREIAKKSFDGNIVSCKVELQNTSKDAFELSGVVSPSLRRVITDLNKKYNHNKQ